MSSPTPHTEMASAVAAAVSAVERAEHALIIGEVSQRRHTLTGVGEALENARTPTATFSGRDRTPADLLYTAADALHPTTRRRRDVNGAFDALDHAARSRCSDALRVPVLLVDFDGHAEAAMLFSHARDQLWEIPAIWVAAIPHAALGWFRAPPADQFWSTVIAADSAPEPTGSHDPAANSILELIAQSPQPVAVAAIAAALDWPPPRARRMLSSLHRRGTIEPVVASGEIRYRLAGSAR